VLGFSIIHVGLAILHAELETCDLDIAGSQIRDKPKNVKAITAILEGSSRSFSAGQDADHLVPFAVATYDTREKSFNGQVELTIKSGFNDNGRVFIRQTDPLPITVLGLIPVFEVGG
jgi:hypothetical protein